MLRATGVSIDKSRTDSKENSCKICDKSFHKQENLEVHLSIHNNDNKCTKCGKIFKRLSSLIGHIQTHYVDEFFNCSHCPSIFLFQNLLDRHIETYHPQKLQKKIPSINPAPRKIVKAKKHQCNQCSKVFIKSSLLERHLLKHSGIKKHFCNICEKYFSQMSTLKQHQLIHNQIRKHKCRKCPLIFSQKGNMKKHMRNVHATAHSNDVLKFHCNSCTCSFKTIGALNKHITNIHSGSQSTDPIGNTITEVMNQISQISNQKTTKFIDMPQIQVIPSDNIQIHEQIIIKQPQTDVVIKEIHYQFKDKSVTLKVQQKIIDSIRFLVCPDTSCEKMFKKPSDLVRHYRSIHKKERIACSICSATFSIESSLKKHLIIHSMTLTCSLCDKKFSSIKKLEAHKEFHIKDSSFLIDDEPFEMELEKPIRLDENGQIINDFKRSLDRPYPCLICSASFKRYSHLKAHETTHMNQDWNEPKPQCEKCKKTFNSVSALNLHKKLHENKVYRCNTCNITVTTERSLKRHFLTHTKQKKLYCCSYCKKLFTNAKNCERHIKGHKDELVSKLQEQINSNTLNFNLGNTQNFSIIDQNLSSDMVLNVPENYLNNSFILLLDPGTDILNKSQVEGEKPTEPVSKTSDINTNYDRMIMENPEMFQIQPSLVDNVQNMETIQKESESESQKQQNQLKEVRFIRLNELSEFDKISKHTNISIEHQDSHFMDFQQPLEQMSQLLNDSDNIEFLPDNIVDQLSAETKKLDGKVISSSKTKKSIRNILESPRIFSPKYTSETVVKSPTVTYLPKTIKSEVPLRSTEDISVKHHRKRLFTISLTEDSQVSVDSLMEKNTNSQNLDNSIKFHGGFDTFATKSSNYEIESEIRQLNQSTVELFDKLNLPVPEKSSENTESSCEEKIEENLNETEIEKSAESSENQQSKTIDSEAQLESQNKSEIVFTKPKRPGKNFKKMLFKNLCEYCDKVFGKPNDLKRHLLTHTKEKPFACTHPGCEKKFALKCTMERHLLLHGDPEKRPTHPCHVCNKQLSSKTNLKLHLQLHSDSKDLKIFECIYCPVKFRTASNLKTHINFHEKKASELGVDPKDVKPRLKSTLNPQIEGTDIAEELINAVVENTSKKIYPCQMCNIVCSNQFSLNRHKANMHGDTDS